MLINDTDGPVLVSDVTAAGGCTGTGYVLRATDLDTGRTWQPYESGHDAVELVSDPGWELPAGWMLLARDGQIAFDRDAGLAAVRVSDGQRVSLPTEP